MIVHVEDGEFQDKRVDDIPIVRNTVIDTQSQVKNNQSLLIGGYYHEEMTIVQKQIPFLGRIPIIGWLFRSKVTQKADVSAHVPADPTPG